MYNKKSTVLHVLFSIVFIKLNILKNQEATKLNNANLSKLPNWLKLL